MRFFRCLCLGCFCILGLALVVAILEAAAPDLVLNISGCKLNPEILPNFTCGDGLVRSSNELVLNLPLVFVYAPAFTLFWHHPPSRTFMLLLYIFDIILVLALTYPPLVLLARKHAKRGG